MSDKCCPTCGIELDFLDSITNRNTNQHYHLWVCHNEDCVDYGSIWNDQRPGSLIRGDPSGNY